MARYTQKKRAFLFGDNANHGPHLAAELTKARDDYFAKVLRRVRRDKKREEFNELAKKHNIERGISPKRWRNAA